jgi:hypothetical protein
VIVSIGIESQLSLERFFFLILRVFGLAPKKRAPSLQAKMASNVDDLKEQLEGFDLMMKQMLDKCLASRRGGPPLTRP